MAIIRRNERIKGYSFLMECYYNDSKMIGRDSGLD